MNLISPSLKILQGSRGVSKKTVPVKPVITRATSPFTPFVTVHPFSSNLNVR